MHDPNISPVVFYPHSHGRGSIQIGRHHQVIRGRSVLLVHQHPPIRNVNCHSIVDLSLLPRDPGRWLSARTGNTACYPERGSHDCERNTPKNDFRQTSHDISPPLTHRLPHLAALVGSARGNSTGLETTPRGITIICISNLAGGVPRHGCCSAGLSAQVREGSSSLQPGGVSSGHPFTMSVRVTGAPLSFSAFAKVST